MAKILFLAHRAPFPPDKGDKIRAFHILKHLAAQHDLWLGAGADDLADLQYLPQAKTQCRDACFAPLGRLRRAFNMAWALLAGVPLSVGRFRHPMLDQWVRRVLSEVRPDIVLVSSSAAAQYVLGRLGEDTRLVVDFVDADAEKWRAYAQRTSGPMRWLYAVEARRLVRFERRVLKAAAAGFLISETERALMARACPDDSVKLHVSPNGVDTGFFGGRSDSATEAATTTDIVFCGRMDYAPNIDGATWFVSEILPLVRRERPDAVFRIVGAAPVAQVLALGAEPGVEVTGTVPDVRPYLARAAVVVAPLRIARGMQNKVLEGLASGRPVVATPAALDGIDAMPGREVLVGADPAAFAAAVCDVLAGRAAGVAAEGRRLVIGRYRWEVQLEKIDHLLGSMLRERPAKAAA